MIYKPVLLSHKKIGPGHYPCTDTQSRDGKIFLPVGGPGNYALYSGDKGKTWTKIEYGDGKKKHAREHFIQLRDGSFYGLSSANQIHRSITDYTQEKIPFVIGIKRAKSIEDIMEGKVVSQFSCLDIPDLAVGYGDSGNTHTGCIDHCVMELENGDILATMYGQFKSDTTLCPYFKEWHNYTFYLYRCWCIISHDGGNTFEFLSTMADVQTYPIADVNAEGYCEPDCLNLGGGHLVAVLRTGGHEVYSPLYCQHSYDSGKTWEKPYEICGWGVLPKLFRMEDGTIVCASGHIHTMLLFSDDEGKTWSEPFIVEPCDGKWEKSPSGYVSAFESSPGEITIVYDDPKEGIAEGSEFLRNVYIRTYRIDRE